MDSGPAQTQSRNGIFASESASGVAVEGASVMMGGPERLWQAVFWNLAGAPVRIVLGVVQTAVTARSLTQDGGALLAHFALINAFVLTAVLITSVGIPQVFSKIAADRLARGDRHSMRSFMSATGLLRTAVWCVLATGMAAGVAVFPSSLPGSVGDALGSGAIFSLTLVWGWFYDLAGLTGRLLSAELEQKWQSIVNACSQAFSIVVIGAGLLFPHHALVLAVAGMALMQCGRVAGHLIVFLCRTSGWRAFNPASGFEIWRSEVGQVLHLSADKLSGYFISPSFLVLAAGYVFSAQTVAWVFLVFDLAAKLTAALGVPFGGLVLPFFGRLNVMGTDSLKGHLRVGLSLTSALGFFVSAVIGAVAVPLGRLLYGDAFSADAPLICLILATLAIEFMTLELVAAYLTIQNQSARLWLARLAAALVVLLVAAVCLLLGHEAEIVLSAVFGVRLVILPLFVGMCDTGHRDIGRLLMPMIGATSAAAMGGYFYLNQPLDVRSVGGAVATAVGIVLLSTLTVFMSDMREIWRRLSAKPRSPC